MTTQRFTAAQYSPTPHRLLPSRCTLCGIHFSYFSMVCKECLCDLPWNTRYCNQCALPLDNHDERCVECTFSPPPFASSRTAFVYRFPINPLINAFKEQHDLRLGRLLAHCLSHQLQEDESLMDLPPEVLIPVPSHPSSIRARGYNPAQLIAKQLSKHLSIPVANRWVAKQQRSNANQKSLSADQRKNNLRRAFSITPTGQQQLHQHFRVAIVDDVITTGATASELASVLLQAGVQEVIVWAIARTP